MSVTVLGESPAPRTRAFGELFRPYLGATAVGVVWLLLSNVFLLAVPRLVNEGIRSIEGTSKGSILSVVGIDAPSVWLLVAAIVVCAIAGGIVRVLSRIVLFNVGRDVERALRSSLFSHLSTLSP